VVGYEGKKCFRDNKGSREELPWSEELERRVVLCWNNDSCVVSALVNVTGER